MDESSDCHTEWSKSDKGQISYDITYMWILKNKKKERYNWTYQTGKDWQTQKKIYGYQRGWWWGRENKLGVWD